jgi:hypothetical protein
MKEKGEGSEIIQAGRPQHFRLPQHQSDSMLPQFLASLTKESPHFQTSQTYENESQQSRDEIPLQPTTADTKPKDIGEFSSDLPHLVASPISSRPPAVTGSDGVFKQAIHGPDENNNNNNAADLGDDDAFGGSGGSRWPRQETLALLKIRSEMDAAFRDASLKAPLWDEVSRKLAELGFHRNAKKCKEKFENVNKYYKRTKAGRSGRQDGKTYKFFNQLEALYGNTDDTAIVDNNTSRNNNIMAASGSSREFQTTPSPPAAAATNRSEETQVPEEKKPPAATELSPMSFSTESSDETHDDNNISETRSSRKRKRITTKKMMRFVEKLMERVMEKQETMQQRFLEMIDKREQDRMIREEAWRRQENVRLNREIELRSQERALSASRDRALIAFLQKVTGQTLHLPDQFPVSQPLSPVPAQQIHPRPDEINKDNNETDSLDPNSKRWPKQEVHGLIKLRSALEPRFHDSGPKAQLWDQISAEMAAMGYHRSAKRCKEKWENINKYFRKAKESNRERPGNNNTCPYFYQLDALYTKGILRYSNSEKLNRTRDQDQQQEELLEQTTCGSSRDDQSPGHDGDNEILAIMPPPSITTAPPPSNFFSADQPEDHVNGGQAAAPMKAMFSTVSEGLLGNSPSKPDSTTIMMFQNISQSAPTLSTTITVEDGKNKDEKQADLDLPYGVYGDRTVNSASNVPRDSSSTFMAMVVDPPQFTMPGSSQAD